jgi:type I restriction enzyme S subunit
MARPGDLVIATTSEDDEALGKAVAWLGDHDVAVSSDAVIFSHTLDPKFLAYFFQSSQFHDQKRRGVTGTKVRRISTGALGIIRVPVPPREVQLEVARILDRFAARQARLEVELEAELKARRQQYVHHRDVLLAFSEGDTVPWRSLGDIATLVRGHDLARADFSNEGTGCIHYGQIYTRYGTWTSTAISAVAPDKAAGLAKVDPGDVIVTNTSENLDDVCKAVAWLGDEQIVTGGHATILKHHENPKYLSYLFQTPAFDIQKRRLATGTKVIDVSAKSLATIRVPIPPLSEQERIVAILDRFDALVNALVTGLRAELAARRQQYEHYRDQLFSFEEAA